MFRDRRDAGKQLALALGDLAGEAPVILAVPRGGVEVGFPIFQELGGELDLVIARKIPAPGNPELAVGAVAPDGTTVLEQRVVSGLGLDSRYLEEAKERELREVRRRLEYYRGERPYPGLKGRTVVVVDDGVATGSTISAALGMVRQQEASFLVLAIPVGPPAALERLRPEVDRVEWLLAPDDFFAVGQYYRQFHQTGDQEVVELLRRAWSETGGKADN